MHTYLLTGHTDTYFIEEKLNFQYSIALLYQIDLLIMNGVRSFVTCLAPGVDQICASYIGGIAQSQRDDSGSADEVSTDHLHLTVFTHCQHGSVTQNDPHHILANASKIECITSQPPESLYMRAVEASTHVLAVYPREQSPQILDYAKARNIYIDLYTPEQIIQMMKYTNDR